jgi:aspartyl/asparaginyl beta-hydroxylase (cupin superfamily)
MQGSSGFTGTRQRPGMPLFPGLSAEPFRDPSDYPAVAQLEAGFAAIAEEAGRLQPEDYLTYFPRGVPDSEAMASAQPGMWKLFLFAHMGGQVQSSIQKCPRTYEIVSGLSDYCGDYPWCDALFSLHTPGTRLMPHCSIDNLRIRIHLGIDIPEGSEIRVDQETRRWQAGKCMVFDESFEHETWNETQQNRLVLIVDVWHPDLTADEREMLLSLFAHSEVRELFFMKRLKNINADSHMVRALREQVLGVHDELVSI